MNNLIRTLLFLCLLAPQGAFANSILLGELLRLEPTELPAFCGDGEFRTDVNDNIRFKLCRNNTWHTFLESEGGLADPMTTEGDLIYQDAAGDPERLGIGAMGTFLYSNGTTPGWRAPLLADLSYDNSTSGLAATDGQAAIDEVEGRLDTAESSLSSHTSDTSNPHSVTALQTSYDNTDSTLSATNVKTGLDELDTDVDSVDSDLSSHTGASTGAHDASAITNSPSGNLTSTDQQSVNNELQGDIDTHTSDTSNPHSVSADQVTYDNSGSTLSATDVDAGLDELDTDLDNHTGAGSGVHGISGGFVGLTDSQTVSNKTILEPLIDIVDLSEQSSKPSAPSGGTKRFYAKNDDKLYSLNSSDEEVEIADTSTDQTFANKTIDFPYIQNGLEFQEHTLTGTETADADKLWLIAADDSKFYSINDAGEATQIGSGGGAGSGGLNLESEPYAQDGLNSWSKFDDGATATGVDFTGGTASLNFTADNSTTRILSGEFKGAYKVAYAAADHQGEGISKDYALPQAVQDKGFLVIEGRYSPSVDISTGDFIFRAYDVTNSEFMDVDGLTDNKLQGVSANKTGEFTAIIDLASDTASVRLGFMRAVTDATAVDFYHSDFKVGIGRALALPGEGPIGEVLAWPGESLPSSDYLWADGSAVSRSEYSQLFDAIGTTHGEGDGSTTFNLPDYRGRFLRGVDDGAGRDPDAGSRTAMNTGGNTGDNVGSIQDDATALPDTNFTTNNDSHDHAQTTYTSSSGSSVGPVAVSSAGGHAIMSKTTESDTHNHSITGGGDSETRPQNAGVNFIVRAKNSNSNIVDAAEMGLQSTDASFSHSSDVATGSNDVVWDSQSIDGPITYNDSTGEMTFTKKTKATVSISHGINSADAGAFIFASGISVSGEGAVAQNGHSDTSSISTRRATTTYTRIFEKDDVLKFYTNQSSGSSVSMDWLNASLVFHPDFEVLTSIAGVNKYQTKTLSSDVTSDGTISEFSIDNLEVGEIYEVDGVAVFFTTANDNVSLLIKNGSTVVGRASVDPADGDNEYRHTPLKALPFEATDQNLTFELTDISGSSELRGDGSRSETHFVLKKLNNYVETDEW